MNAPEWLQNFAEAVSLVWTWPTVILGISVVAHWAPYVYKQLKEQEDLTSRDWLIMGVTVGFLGGVVDNIWWGVAWSFDFVELGNHRDWCFRHGVYSNIIFRQIFGAYAAYCHLVAFYEARSKGMVNVWMSLSLAVGLIYACVITVIKRI